MKIILALMLLSTSAFAADLRINTFYRLDRQSHQDTAAEVCFSLKPAPSAPVYAQVTVDPGTRQQGYYSGWLDSRGSTCVVVSTLRGRVEVNIPSMNLNSNKEL
jgi:hypothetical protein